MRRKVCHATNRVALNFYVRAEHLSDERLQAAKFDDEQLVVS